MHKIQEKEFTLEDFSTDHLDDVSLDTFNYIIAQLEYDRKLYLKTKVKPMKDESKRAELMKKYWWQMIQLLPSSYNQTRNVMMNYEVLANIYKSRKNHKLDEWREFCKWIEELPYSELIYCETDEILAPNEQREKLGLESISKESNKDLVEVTRCKNCQFYVSEEDKILSAMRMADGYCANSDEFVNEDDFCSCAER